MTRKYVRPANAYKPHPLVQQPAPKNRVCLKCRKEFKSEGPHNRICGKCGSGNSRVGGAKTYKGVRRSNGVKD